MANPTRPKATKQAKPTGLAKPTPAAPPATTDAVPTLGLVVGDAITLVGAALAIVGALLPWQKANSSQALGYEFDDGKIFIFAAVLTILASGCLLGGGRLPRGIVTPVARLLGSGASLAVLTGGYIVSFSLLNLRDIATAVDRFNGLISGSASVGPGIYLDLAAGVVIMAGAGVGLFLWRD